MEDLKKIVENIDRNLGPHKSEKEYGSYRMEIERYSSGTEDKKKKKDISYATSRYSNAIGIKKKSIKLKSDGYQSHSIEWEGNTMVQTREGYFPESQFEAALLHYWGQYSDEFNSRQDAFELLEKAGENGDATLKKKIGDFYRFECDEVKADEYYKKALIENEKKAQENDAEAQFTLAQYYTFGIGTKANDALALQWCQRAAFNGHQEAQYMMANFWQCGNVLPVDYEMSSLWEQIAQKKIELPQQQENIFNEISQLQGELQYAQNEVERQKQLISTPRETLKVNENYDKHNKISDAIFNVIFYPAIVYVLLSIISFFPSACGWHEKGISHYLNIVFYYLMYVPNMLLVKWFGEGNLVPTMEAFFKVFQENILMGFSFIFSLVIYVLWFVVVFIVLFIILMIISPSKKVKMSESEIKERDLKDEQDFKQAQKKLQEVQDKWNHIEQTCQLSKDDLNEVAIVGMNDLQRLLKIKNISDVISRWHQDSQQEKHIYYPIHLKADENNYSHMALYFVLKKAENQYLEEGKTYAGYCHDPLRTIPMNSQFMKGYRAYRRGINFNYAGNCLIKSINNDENIPEAGYYLAQMYKNEYYVSDIYAYAKGMERERYFPVSYLDAGTTGKGGRNDLRLQKANQLMEAAKKAGCLKAKDDEESIIQLCWKDDPEALQKLAQLLESNEELSKFLNVMSLKGLQLEEDCGNPHNEPLWHGYITGCSNPLYAVIREEYLTMSDNGDYEGARRGHNGLLRKLDIIADNGIFNAYTLRDFILETLSDDAWEEEQMEQMSSQSSSTHSQDASSFQSAVMIPSVITGPYGVTYRRVSFGTYSADYISDHGDTVTIHDSDISATGGSATTSAGYFYW